MIEKAHYQATGRRKESVARVRMAQGTGKITVNDRPFEEFFPRESHRLVIMQPIELVKLPAQYDIFAIVDGGGSSGQAGAMRLGIARTLVKIQQDLKTVLKKAKFLTRDARARERKKYGRKRARRRFQYTKR
jgi:small subunit ribosomal protein S9